MSTLGFIFIWLDKRVGNLPGSNEHLKSQFRKLLNPIRQFDRPSACFDHIELTLKDKRVIFVTSDAHADEDLLIKLAALPHVYHLYVYGPNGRNYRMADGNLREKMNWLRVIQFDEHLYEQMIRDLMNIAEKQFDRLGKGQDARDVVGFARKFLATIEDKDEDFRMMDINWIARENALK